MVTKAKQSKPAAQHPAYADMILAAIKALKDRKGATKQSIQRYIKSNYKVSDNVGPCTRMAMARLIKNGKIEPTGHGGKGLNGRFKLKASAADEKKKAPAKKKTVKKAVKKAAKKQTKKSEGSAKKPSKKKPSPKKKKPKSPAKKAQKKPKKSADKPAKKQSVKKTSKKSPKKKRAQKKK